MAAWTALARHIGTASLAGIITGALVGGLLGRVMMRISGFAAGPNMVGVHTDNGNRVGDITFAGTAGLVVFVGLSTGLMGGVVYAVLEPWLRRLRPWHGLAYGAILLATFGYTVLDPFNFDFARFGPLLLNVIMFGALFIVFGVCVAWIFDRLRALAASTRRSGRAVDLLSWLSLGLASFAVVGAVLAASGADDRDRLFVLVTIGGLALAAIVHWRGLPHLIGYASLGAVLVLGAMRTFDDVQLFRGF